MACGQIWMHATILVSQLGPHCPPNLPRCIIPLPMLLAHCPGKLQDLFPWSANNHDQNPNPRWGYSRRSLWQSGDTTTAFGAHDLRFGAGLKHFAHVTQLAQPFLKQHWWTQFETKTIRFFQTNASRCKPGVICRGKYADPADASCLPSLASRQLQSPAQVSGGRKRLFPRNSDRLLYIDSSCQMETVLQQVWKRGSYNLIYNLHIRAGTNRWVLLS